MSRKTRLLSVLFLSVVLATISCHDQKSFQSHIVGEEDPVQENG
ncbi:MAG: hypothetical protein ACOX3Q_13685 [Clostridia bacterium]